jgi:histidyl-tRNA synthetase
VAQPDFTTPIGTRDVLPPESSRWTTLVAAFATQFEAAGYGLVLNPMFEDLGVFQRLGEGTDVVRKEMYDFFDKADPPRHLALRPEGTASVVRAYNQHQPTIPWKTWYVTPCFRYESPQAGRFRQHHQLGAEIIGSDDPDADVEVIALQHDFYASLGLSSVRLLVNSMGTSDDRNSYRDLLATYLEKRRGDLDPADRDKVATHPLRLLDSKRADTIAVTDEAPRLVDHLSVEAAARFDRVRAGLDAVGVAYEIEPRLVRGLDYYGHTTFEFQATALDGAQNGIGGGGRYDGLAAALGGKPAAGVGFGSGIERVLLACDAEGVFARADNSVDVFVVDVVGGEWARDLTTSLRRAGVAADRAFDQRSMKAQMKVADRSGARLALIVGADEEGADAVTIRDLRTDEPQQTVGRDDLVAEIRKRLQ